MDLSNPSQEGPKPVYLRLGSEKLFEIILDGNISIVLRPNLC